MKQVQLLELHLPVERLLAHYWLHNNLLKWEFGLFLAAEALLAYTELAEY